MRNTPGRPADRSQMVMKMNRRSFIKRLGLLFASIHIGGVLKRAWALEDIPTPLPYPGFISEYMKAGLNLCLNEYGIYVGRVETVIDPYHIGHHVRGVAVKYLPGLTVKGIHLVDKEGFVVPIDHRTKAKYFSFIVDEQAMNDYKKRQVILRHAAVDILKAYK